MKRSTGRPAKYSCRVLAEFENLMKSDFMWYVYFLKLNCGKIYIGSTNSIRRRLIEHSSGRTLSTKAFLPVKLLSYIAVPSEHHARKLEKYFKSGSGKAILKKRILSDEAFKA